MFRSLRITFLGKSRVIVDKNPNFIFYQSCGITIFSCIVLRVLVGKRLMISMSHLKGLDFTEEDWECSWIFWNPAWRDPRRTILKRDLELIGGSVGKSGRLNGFTSPPSQPLRLIFTLSSLWPLLSVGVGRQDWPFNVYEGTPHPNFCIKKIFLGFVLVFRLFFFSF